MCVPQVALPKVKLLCVVEANEGAGPGRKPKEVSPPSGNREPQNVQGRSWEEGGGGIAATMAAMERGERNGQRGQRSVTNLRNLSKKHKKKKMNKNKRSK